MPPEPPPDTLAPALESLDKTMKELISETRGETNSSTKLQKAMTAARNGFDSAAGLFVDAMLDAETLQKRNLAIGTNLATTIKTNNSTINQLSGNMVGYTTALEVLTSVQEAGLSNTSKSMMHMVAMAKSTGQNEKALIGSMVQLERTGNYSAEQQENLAHDVVGLSQTFKISAEQLVGTLEKTAGKLVAMSNVLGNGASVQKEVAAAMASLGPGGADMAGSLLTALSDGGAMIQAHLLGVTKERRALMNEEVGAGTAFLRRSGENAQKILDQFTKGTDKMFGMQLATQIYGEELVKAAGALNKFQDQANAWADTTGKAFSSNAAMLDAYESYVNEEKAVHQEFKNSWENFKDRVVAPLQKFATGAATKIFELLSNDLWLKTARTLATAVASFGAAVTIFSTAARMSGTEGGASGLLKKMAGGMEMKGPLGGPPKMVSGFGKMGDLAGAAKGKVGDIAGKLTGPLQKAGGGIVGKILGGIGPALSFIPKMLMTALGPLGLIAMGVMTILALAGDFKGFMKALKPGIDAMKSALKPLLKIIMEVIGVSMKISMAIITPILKYIVAPILKYVIAPILKGVFWVIAQILNVLTLGMAGFGDIANSIFDDGEGTAAEQKTAENTKKQVEAVKYQQKSMADLLREQAQVRLIDTTAAGAAATARAQAQASTSTPQTVRLEEDQAEVLERTATAAEEQRITGEDSMSAMWRLAEAADIKAGVVGPGGYKEAMRKAGKGI